MEECKCLKTEYHLHVLRCLLNYHRRMMVGIEAFDKECSGNHADICKHHFDGYAEALEEAIRCIEIVHKDELLSP